MTAPTRSALARLAILTLLVGGFLVAAVVGLVVGGPRHATASRAVRVAPAPSGASREAPGPSATPDPCATVITALLDGQPGPALRLVAPPVAQALRAGAGHGLGQGVRVAVTVLGAVAGHPHEVEAVVAQHIGPDAVLATWRCRVVGGRVVGLAQTRPAPVVVIGSVPGVRP